MNIEIISPSIDASTLTLPVDKTTIQTPKTKIDGRSPFGMSRKYRRALFASVREGTATENDVERFKSLGKEAYPWMQSKHVISTMIKRSVPASKHVKLHKWQKKIAATDTVEI